jgi:hypothetical protein
MTDPLRQFVLSSGTGTDTLVVRLMGTMPLAEAEQLARSMATGRRWQRRRLDERDELILQLVAHYDLTKSRKIAAAIHSDLVRYGASGHRVNRAPPADDKRALLHRVLDLIGDGKIPGAVQIRSILSGGR